VFAAFFLKKQLVAVPLQLQNDSDSQGI